MDQKSGFAEMPESIGRYQVQGSIGFGAMGAVYKAFDPLIKRTLAIKTIRLDIPRNSPQYRSFIERFYHEARISGTLSHPNIVTLFDIGEEGGIPYLAMEYVEGETLASMIEKGVRFPPEKVINVVSQAASAIDYAHTKGVIHRDIKPSNLMLSEGDRLKVTDFGIAKLVDSEMTQAGTLLGTPSYMSPEQAMGEKLDGRSDIFSLGVCAFEMLCGEQPFPGTNVTSILYKLVHVDPVEPANLEMHGLVPQKWHEVFGKALAKKPDDRFQTAAEFVQDLEYCLGSWFGAVGSDATAEPTLGLGVMSPAAELHPPRPAPAPAPSPQAAPPATPPRTEPMPVPPLPAAAVPPPKAAPVHPGATLPPVPRKEAPLPPADAPLPATVHMKAPSEADLATVAIPTAAVPDVTVRAAAPEATVRAPAPKTGAPKAPAPLTAPMAAPAPTAKAQTPGRTGVSPAMVLGGAALFFVIAVAVTVTVWLKQHSAAQLTPATPAVEATPVPPPASPPQIEEQASLHIETTPPGASVSVNGEAKGASPLDVAGLPVGNYEVRAELKGYEPKSETVALVAGSGVVPVKLALTRTAPTTGSIEIGSDPPGATVAVDGAKAGETPVADLKLKPGEHKVDLTKDGYESWADSVTVEAGKKTRIQAALRAIPKATPPPPKPEAPDTARVYLNTQVDTPAKKLSGPSASYPSSAPRLRSGEAVSASVTFVVDENGDVQDLKVTESAGKAIDDGVLAAVRKWKYAPAVKGGEKVKVKIGFKQTFRAG